jgi:hypothetical protein
MELRGSSEYIPDYASIRIGLDASLMPLAFAGLQGLYAIRFWEKPKLIPVSSHKLSLSYRELPSF